MKNIVIPKLINEKLYVGGNNSLIDANNESKCANPLYTKILSTKTCKNISMKIDPTIKVPNKNKDLFLLLLKKSKRLIM